MTLPRDDRSRSGTFDVLADHAERDAYSGIITANSADPRKKCGQPTRLFDPIEVYEGMIKQGSCGESVVNTEPL
jgi:hypothetical protein